MTSLYRKWRSRTFEELVGQEHVVRTLRNAVRDERVAHAYLFTGPRGTGKTSTARILARALNCLDPRDGDPCNACERCVAANEGRALDVIEIDAASNTSVDNVRDLRERVAYAASEGRYKVYIIDEVHRLSGAAFDAFLKTLEEPPAHVVFVFASTEPHKVPATIISRCQRFDFRRMTLRDTIGHLKAVAIEERIAIDDDALTVLARGAGGSMRDALGLLDKVAAFTADPVDADAVRAALGVAEPTLVAGLVDHLLDANVGEGLRQCAAFVEAGGDPGQLVGDLVEYWRALLLAVTGAGGLEEAVDPALVAHAERHATLVSERQVVAALTALTEPPPSARYDLAPELPLEMGYVRAMLAVREAGGDSPPSPPRSGREAPPRARRAETVSTERAAPAPQGEQVPATAEASQGPVPPAEVPGPPAAVPAPLEPVVGTSNGSLSQPYTQEVKEQTVAALGEYKSLQAVLRSGFLLSVAEGEVTFGFEYPFHANFWADARKRRLLEEAVSRVLGASYRANCILTTKAEVRATLGDAAVVEDDGFAAEAAERLRRWHVRELGDLSS